MVVFSGGTRLRITLLILVFLSGCNSIVVHEMDEHEQSLSKQGFDSLHSTSCGPRALSNLQSHYDMHPDSAADMSKEILSDTYPLGRMVAGLFSIVDYRFFKITWPHQMVSASQRLGYHVEEYASVERCDVEKLDEEVTGIVLLKLLETSLLFHWEFFSTRADLIRYYDDWNVDKVRKIYIIGAESPYPRGGGTSNCNTDRRRG